MHRIALTGGIASGKSFVADEFAARGASIIDSDVLAREVVEPGTAGLARIIERFGPDMLDGEGKLDRARLGELVFSNEEARQELNSIVHPLVRERAAALEAAAPEGTVVIHVIPLLVETGLDRGFDRIIVVDVPVEVQLDRLRRRNGLSVGEAQARISAQATREERAAVASYFIDNSGERHETAAQVDRVWAQLQGAR